MAAVPVIFWSKRNGQTKKRNQNETAVIYLFVTDNEVEVLFVLIYAWN